MILRLYWAVFSALFLTSQLFLAPLEAGPVYGRAFLAAGNGNPDFQDGAFDEASLHGPEGLALSPDGAKLYIADTLNDALRELDFEKASRLRTLVGSPGDSRLLSPTALVLNAREGGLYCIAGSEGSLHRFGLLDGSLQEMPLKHLCALAQNPDSALLYALDGKAALLYIVDESNGNEVSMTALSELLGAQGEMLATSQGLYFLRSGTGELGSLLLDGRPITSYTFSALQGQQHLRWSRIRDFGPEAQGLASSKDLDGSDLFLWIWDEGSGIFKKLDLNTDSLQDYALKDLNGQWLKRPNPLGSFFRKIWSFLILKTRYLLYLLSGKWLLNSNEDAFVQASTRPLLRGPLSMIADPARNLLYIAEANGNRIVGLQHPRWDQARGDELPDYESGSKVPGVTRILLLGDSMVFSGDPLAGDPSYLEGGFGERLQTYLNLASALKGKARRYEVIEQSVAFGNLGGGMTSYYVNLPAELEALKADEVITLLTYMNVNGEIMAMTRTESPDDIPWALVDPQFFAQSPQELQRNYGPLHRAFLAWTAHAPEAVRAWVRPDADGTHLLLPRGNAFDEAIADPGYRAWLMKIHSKILDAAVKKAKAEDTRLIEVLLPLRNQLSPGENLGGGVVRSDSTLANWMDADLKAAADSRGVAFINLTPALRNMEPSLFPLVGYNTHHYRTQGVNWAALATAMSYVERSP